MDPIYLIVDVTFGPKVHSAYYSRKAAQGAIDEDQKRRVGKPYLRNVLDIVEVYRSQLEQDRVPLKKYPDLHLGGFERSIIKKSLENELEKLTSAPQPLYAHELAISSPK